MAQQFWGCDHTARHGHKSLPRGLPRRRGLLRWSRHGGCVCKAARKHVLRGGVVRDVHLGERCLSVLRLLASLVDRVAHLTTQFNNSFFHTCHEVARGRGENDESPPPQCNLPTTSLPAPEQLLHRSYPRRTEVRQPLGPLAIDVASELHRPWNKRIHTAWRSRYRLPSTDHRSRFGCLLQHNEWHWASFFLKKSHN